ncbi:hypothetical protein [Streptomyces sviceus]|uniref:hypothetical protein n=1 Tax=Streptomyces sviceus TaxID=285530 RepID=UPI0036E99E57
MARSPLASPLRRSPPSPPPGPTSTRPSPPAPWRTSPTCEAAAESYGYGYHGQQPTRVLADLVTDFWLTYDEQKHHVHLSHAFTTLGDTRLAHVSQERALGAARADQHHDVEEVREAWGRHCWIQYLPHAGVSEVRDTRARRTRPGNGRRPGLLA